MAQAQPAASSSSVKPQLADLLREKQSNYVCACNESTFGLHRPLKLFLQDATVRRDVDVAEIDGVP